MKADEIRERLHGCEILVVPYCHADWAWTHTRQWHVLRYVHTFERVLEIMRDAPGFRWYFDTYVTELKPLLDLRPDLLPELRQRVAEGRIAICGGFANVRPNMVGEEDRSPMRRSHPSSSCRMWGYLARGCRCCSSGCALAR